MALPLACFFLCRGVAGPMLVSPIRKLKPLILLPLCLLIACHGHRGLNGVYLQKDPKHIFTALKFYPNGEVDLSDSHISIIKATYTAEADRITIDLGQHPLFLRMKDKECLDGGSIVGVFCKSSRSSN